MEQAKDFTIHRLGECTISSPMRGVRFTNDQEHILLHSDLAEIKRYLDESVIDELEREGFFKKFPVKEVRK